MSCNDNLRFKYEFIRSWLDQNEKVEKKRKERKNHVLVQFFGIFVL